jgi:uncharacterized phiE125 gp8 family phage protein
MSLELITPPAELPLTLQELKAQLRLEDSETAENALLMGYLRASILWTEDFLRRSLITQTWDLFLPGFCEVVVLPNPPLQSVGTISYLDTADASQTLGAAVYQTDMKADPGRLVRDPDESFPATSLLVNAVTIRFTAGYGLANDVPEDIRLALLLLAGHWYEHREDTAMAAIQRIPMGAEPLLWPHRNLAATAL